MLVNKPQFDTELIKVGMAVRLNKTQGCYSNGQLEKFNDGDFALVKVVEPLRVHVLLVNNKVAEISVDLVSAKKVSIEILGGNK